MSEATEMLALYLAAEKDLLKNGKTNRINDQWMTTEDLPEIRKGRQEWERKVRQEQQAASGASGSRFSLGRIA